MVYVTPALHTVVGRWLLCEMALGPKLFHAQKTSSLQRSLQKAKFHLALLLDRGDQ